MLADTLVQRLFLGEVEPQPPMPEPGGGVHVVGDEGEVMQPTALVSGA
jgi:hypothetical protein